MRPHPLPLSRRERGETAPSSPAARAEAERAMPRKGILKSLRRMKLRRFSRAVAGAVFSGATIPTIISGKFRSLGRRRKPLPGNYFGRSRRESARPAAEKILPAS